MENKDIFMGLDKDLVRTAMTFAQINGVEDFSVVPLHVNIIKKDGEVMLEGELLTGDTLPIDITEKQEKFLKECADPCIHASLVYVRDIISVCMCMGEQEEDEELLEYMYDKAVEYFIEYKGFKTKEELEQYAHSILDDAVERNLNVNKLDKEERKRIGVDFLFGRATCPTCGSDNIMDINNASVEDMNAYLYGCVDCRNVYCVSTNEYNVVTDFGMLESNPNNSNQKKKKKKKKKAKKTFGKRKK